MLRIRGTSTASSYHPCKCNWTPSRDFYPAHKTIPFRLSDRQLILSFHPRQHAIRRRIREVSLAPVFVLSSENLVRHELTRQSELPSDLYTDLFSGRFSVNVDSLYVSCAKYSRGERLGECGALSKAYKTFYKASWIFEIKTLWKNSSVAFLELFILIYVKHKLHGTLPCARCRWLIKKLMLLTNSQKNR